MAQIIFLSQRAAKPGFSPRDLAELERWSSGERRFALDDGEAGPFATLYFGRLPWASWAVARQDGEVLVWNCITLGDLGRFACMSDALAAIRNEPEAEIIQVPSNIIPFTAARARAS